MTVLKVEPGKRPVPVEIGEDLEALQSAVGGYIEAVYPFRDPVALICNEEGKYLNLPPNRALCTGSGEVYDIVCGPFLVVGLTEDNFGSLSPALSEKYREHYRDPERFAITESGRILVTKIVDPDAIPWQGGAQTREAGPKHRSRGGDAR